MKKFLFISFMALCFMGLGLMASAQQSLTVSKATLTNTDTSYLSVRLPFYADIASFQIVDTKNSGTVAGKAYLQGSLDGVNYLTIGADSLTLADQAINTQIWSVSVSPYTFYRIMVKTTGGVSAPTGFWLARKQTFKQY